MRIAVRELALACCALESATALATSLPHRVGEVEVVNFDPAEAADLHVLLVAGTITRAGAQAVWAAYAELPEPRQAVAFGVCAGSGGPYWDSPLVVQGLAELLPVARYVPGCPPPASAVLDAILATAGAHV